MRQLLIALALWLGLAHNPALACTFCAGSLMSRLTLREHRQQAEWVIAGRLQNPQLNSQTFTGKTEFVVVHVNRVGPKNPVRPGQQLVIAQYLPAKETETHLMFGSITDNQFDLTFGIKLSNPLVDYINGLAKIASDDEAARLRHCFDHLDSADEAVAADAFLEIAKTPDETLIKSKQILSAAKLRAMVQNPKTPAERLSVYGLLIGLCGSEQDADLLKRMTSEKPLPERTASNLGGLLAGLILLDPKAGWQQVNQTLVDSERPFHERLNVINTLRFFQGSRPEYKSRIVAAYNAIIEEGELADLAIDDLRRWQWWSTSETIFKLYETNPRPPAIVRRAIVRYALQCPEESAKRLVARARNLEPDLVGEVEHTLRLLSPKKD